jgi:hypothetical protein
MFLIIDSNGARLGAYTDRAAALACARDLAACGLAVRLVRGR